ncbi:MAG TPA: PPC domain-containing protein [Gemmataceae bacterium]|nr:PPC domain-containing protein [Gemmataceae bacterium]
MCRKRPYTATQRWRILALALLGLAGGATPAAAQPQAAGLPNPRLTVLTPAGGKAGTVVEVAFAGTDLEEPQTLLFSHPAIQAEPIVTPPPPPDPKKPAPMPPAKPTVSKFKVTIPADVPVGLHDARLVGRWGISNPRAFVVGDLNEVLEKEPNNDVPEAQRVELNTTVNGVIAAPTDVDYYVCAGKKGQRVVISCLASTIDSRLLAEIQVYNAKGRLLAANRSYDGGDALTDITVPEDGDYYVRLCQFTHTQGGPEFFYRLSISTAPWIDAIHPCVVEPGKPAQLTVYGRNLPGGQLDPAAVIDGRVLEKAVVTVNVPTEPAARERLDYSGRVPPPAAGLNGFAYHLRNQAGSSNPFLLTFARAPVVLDNEKNDTADSAQEITLPCEIAGRVEKKRDRDWYVFQAKKGEVYNIELLAERLGSSADMYFVLRNATANQDLVEADDTPETISLKLFTRTSDPAVYRFTVPADGKYHLLVASRNANLLAGPHHYYRVRITPEQPDFQLVVMPPSDFAPDGCCVRQGSNQFYTVYAWRQDGFNGEIALTVEGLPAGVTCPPQVLGTGLRQTTLVVSAAADAPPWAGEIKVRGTATIRGQTVVREARPASITWPVQPGAPIPTISRLDRGLVLAVRDQPPFNLTATLDKPVVLQGDKANIQVKVDRLWPDFKTPLNLQIVLPTPGQNPNQSGELPANLAVNNNQPLAVAPDKKEATMAVEIRPNVAPGVYNLVLKGTAQIPFNKDPMAKQKQNINVILPATPVTLTVLPKQVANVTVAPANPMLKVGEQTEVVVKVARMHDYAGEFKVQLVLPAGAKGISADEVTIPAGADEVKVVLRAEPDAPPGNRPDLIFRATARLTDSITTTQEVKFSVNVVK